MIVVEQQHEQEPDGHGDKDPFDVEMPELDEPATVHGWIECACVRQLGDIGLLQDARKMGEACPKQGGELRMIYQYDM